MGLILCIETTTSACSVALAADGILLRERTDNSAHSHASQLTPFMDQVVRDSGKSLEEIDAVAVSKGPGSYTGLRIGVAAAKGLCYALDKPLLAVHTLQALAWGLSDRVEHLPGLAELEQKIYCPMLDARRMEVYCGFFDSSLSRIGEIRAEIIEETSFLDQLDKGPVIFGGNGALKCREILEKHHNACFIDSLELKAHFMIPFAEKKWIERAYEDLAYFEPFYLKDFVAAKPKVKGLH